MKIALIVDNPYRDLPGLVLVAMNLCQYGVTCYLVPMNLRNQEIWTLAPDFVLLNYLRTNNEKIAGHLLKAGIKVGVLDTEGGVLSSLESYAKTMAPDANVRHKITCFCSWGSKLARYAVQKAWYLDSQIAVTGNPRFDFYVHPWYEAALKISPYAGNFPKPMVLINGNFPLANPRFQTPEEEVRMYVEHFGHGENEVLQRQQVQKESMLGLVELANHLAVRFPKVTFVYRPHPFEKLETYMDLLDSHNNLHLIKQGTVDGWILRSCAVIQRSCSTAIEANLAGVPALSPTWIPTSVMETAEAVSIPSGTEEELIEQLDAVLKGQLTIPDTIHHTLNEVIGDWFYKIDGNAHQRVGETIIASLEKSRAKVSLNYCWDRAYGLLLGSPRTRKEMVRAAASKVLKQSLYWSFRHWREIIPNPNLPWDRTEKYFGVEQVQVLVNAIQLAARESHKGDWHDTCIQTAQEHGDYHFRYLRGRSVTLFPK